MRVPGGWGVGGGRGAGGDVIDEVCQTFPLLPLGLCSRLVSTVSKDFRSS